MGLIKVETFSVDVGATLSTYTLTNSVGNINSAFIRYNCSTDKSSGGPTGSTANTGPNIAHCAVALTGVSTLTFYKNTSTIVKVVGEVWRYVGVASGGHEFIVRGRYAVTVTGLSTSQAVASITTEDNCVPFITGVNTSEIDVANYEMTTFAAHMDGLGNCVISRNNSGTSCTVYVTVVEFTGSAWFIGHGVSSAHDTVAETVTLNTDSTGTGGTTFDVTNWETAFIEGSMEGDSTETGLSDVIALVYPGGATTTAIFSVVSADSAGRNDGSGYIHVMKNTSLSVKRAVDTNVAEGNGTFGTVAWPTGASTARSIDELGLEWFVTTSGTGTAHARGRLATRITNSTGTITHWVHRSGNTIIARYGVIDLTAVANSAVFDVDTDNVITNTQTNVVITGFGFEATKGTGKVELVQNSNYTGTIVLQTTSSWSDTSIQFDTTAGGLADTACYIFVTNSSSDVALLAIIVGFPPWTYEEKVKLLNPSRYWMFQNSYIDEIGTAIFNANQTGVPTFVTSVKLCYEDTHSIELDDAITTDMRTGPNDISEINTTAQEIRYMGGWIQLNSVHQVLAVLYEEGAQINNIAILLGFGNILMAQVADTGDDYVQAYSDFTLAVNRTYHVMFKFEATAYDSEFRLFIDGVKQTRSSGNPWTATNLDSHSGNINFGHEPGENLEVGGTDIAFSSPKKCYYAHWANWSGSILTEVEIREELFEKGANPSVTILSDTKANMQIALDVYKDTVRGDSALAIRVEEPSDATDLELSVDNITFNSRCSIEFQYYSGGTLTLALKNGSKVDLSKLSIPYGGAIVIVNDVTIKITVKDTSGNIIVGARVLIEASSGGDLAVGTDILAGVSDSLGEVTVLHRYTTDQPITGYARKGSGTPLYKQGNLSGTIINTGYYSDIYLVDGE